MDGAENKSHNGAEAGTGDGSGNDNPGADFPGVDDTSIRRPSRRNKPRERILTDKTQVKWCLDCRKCGDHFRAGYPAAEVGDDVSGEAVNVATGDGTVVHDSFQINADDEVSDGIFTRLYMAGSF